MNEHNTYPLHRAIAVHQNEVLPRISASDLSVVNHYGFTLLMEAALAGNEEATRHLCAMGANVHDKDPNGNTALHLSARNGGQVAAVLLEAGADPMSFNSAQETPLIHALSQNKVPTLLPLLQAYKAKNISIEGEEDWTGMPAVNLVADACRMEELRLMLTMGSHLGACDDNGNTPLLKAAQDGLTNAVRVLLEAGDTPNTANQQDETALHLAARGHHTEIISLLLAAGANPNVKDAGGNTPLSLAVRHFKIRTAMLLVEAGADVTERFSWKKYPYMCSTAVYAPRLGRISRAEMAAIAPLRRAFEEAYSVYYDARREDTFDYLLLAIHTLQAPFARLLVRKCPSLLPPELAEPYHRFISYFSTEQ